MPCGPAGRVRGHGPSWPAPRPPGSAGRRASRGRAERWVWARPRSPREASRGGRRAARAPRRRPRRPRWQGHGHQQPRRRPPPCSSVVTVVRWSGVQPDSMRATGVSGRRPARTSPAAVSARRVTPMSSTRVASTGASLRAAVTASAPSWAEATTKEAVMPRCVTGIPAAAGTETADVTPGTTSTGTAFSAQCSASSPPRPRTNGSPPLSRTTCFPAFAWSTRSSLIRSCPTGWLPGVLPTSMTSTSVPRVAEQSPRSEAVHDDHVSRGEQGATTHRDEVLGAGTAPHQRDPAHPART